MTIRFLLHDIYIKGGGVLTVTLGLAQALAAKEDVEIVSLFGHDGAPAHRIDPAIPVRFLIDKQNPAPDRDRLGHGSPSAFMPRHEPRFRTYSAYTDRVLEDYLGSLRDGALVTMQPGMSLASARFGTPGLVRIAQDHRPFMDRPRDIRRAYVESAPNLDAFLTLTTADETAWRELIGDVTRVRRMLNGNPRFDGPSSSLESKVAIAAGRLERSKGFDLLVDAWQVVASRHPDWQLHIYGQGGQADALRSQIDSLGLAGQVRLMGFSDQLQQRLAESSLFVLSSRVDGTAMVLVEAMSCGVPVVSTDAPTGPAEIVRHGEDGLLVTNQDVQALAEGILTMIELPVDERRAMGSTARRHAEERSYPAVAEQWRALIEECAADPARTARTTPEAAPANVPAKTSDGGAVKPARRRTVSLVLNPPAAPEPERTYVVFGTRRGGTSMVAGIVRALGIDLGDPGARKNNEDPRFHPRPASQLRQRVSERNAEAKVWGWKFPGAGNYLPDVYNELRNPYFIVVYRDPVAAALSQQRLDHGDNVRGDRLALHESNANNTTNTGFALSTDRPCLLVSNERATAHPRRLIDDVADFCQVPRPEGDLRERILAYIEPGQYKSFDEFFTS